MLDKKFYVNGQRVHELKNDYLTYFFKNGRIKAEGPFVKGQMEGKWKFYRESGALWQIGNFKANKKNGAFVRYSKIGEIEFEGEFLDNKVLKK